MPEFTIGQDRVDFDQLREVLQSQLDNYDSWNDILDAGTGQMLLDFVAAIGAFNQQAIFRALQERNFDTQVTPAAVFRLARSLGVHIIRKYPARVRTQLGNHSSLTITIPPYSHFVIDGVDYFNRQALNFRPRESALNIELFQGAIFRQLVVSSGELYQTYQIGNPDYSVSEYYDEINQVGDIFAVLNPVVPNDGNLQNIAGGLVFQATRQGLWHHSELDQVFFESTRVDGRVELQFGNNVYGVSPPLGQNLVLVWAQTLGAAGNNSATELDVAYPLNISIRGTTQTPVSSGGNERGPDFYKRFGSSVHSARRRAVTREDYRALIQGYPGVVDVLVEGQQDILEQQTTRASGMGANAAAAWVTDRAESQVRSYSLAAGLSDDSQAAIQLESDNADPRGLWVNTAVDPQQALIVDGTSRKVFSYNVETGAFLASNDLISVNTEARDLHSNGTVALVVDEGDMHVYGYNNSDFSRNAAVELDIPVSGIRSVAVDSGGSGYSSAPNVTVADPVGSGAQLTAEISNGEVSALTVVAEGQNYSTPTITIDPPSTGETANAGAVQLTPKRPSGIWFDDNQILISFIDGDYLAAFDRTSSNARDRDSDIPLVAANESPVALYSNRGTAGVADNQALLWVVDDTLGNNQVHAYDFTTRTANAARNFELALAGRNNIQWMNTIRLTLLTEETWDAVRWETFINWLSERSIATTRYVRGTAQTVDLNIDLTAYCFNRVNLAEAQALIRQQLSELFAAGVDVLGRSYYLSNLYEFVETLRDSQGPIVDYLTLHQPTADVLIKRRQYINLNSIQVRTEYSERNTPS